jgi:hypothetical protein
LKKGKSTKLNRNEGGEEMQTDIKQLEAYERIIQNLFALKEEAIETKHQAIRGGRDGGNIAYAFRPT